KRFESGCPTEKMHWNTATTTAAKITPPQTLCRKMLSRRFVQTGVAPREYEALFPTLTAHSRHPRGSLNTGSSIGLGAGFAAIKKFVNAWKPSPVVAEISAT